MSYRRNITNFNSLSLSLSLSGANRITAVDFTSPFCFSTAVCFRWSPVCKQHHSALGCTPPKRLHLPYYPEFVLVLVPMHINIVVFMLLCYYVVVCWWWIHCMSWYSWWTYTGLLHCCLVLCCCCCWFRVDVILACDVALHLFRDFQVCTSYWGFSGHHGGLSVSDDQWFQFQQPSRKNPTSVYVLM